jgi:hypothetical protein
MDVIFDKLLTRVLHILVWRGYAHVHQGPRTYPSSPLGQVARNLA